MGKYSVREGDSSTAFVFVALGPRSALRQYLDTHYNGALTIADFVPCYALHADISITEFGRLGAGTLAYFWYKLA